MLVLYAVVASLLSLAFCQPPSLPTEYSTFITFYQDNDGQIEQYLSSSIPLLTLLDGSTLIITTEQISVLLMLE